MIFCVPSSPSPDFSEETLKETKGLRSWYKSEYLLSSSSTAVSNYQPPQDSMMGPPGYPPATGQTAIPIPQRPAYGNGVPRFNNFRRDPKNEWWNLPSAMHQTGAIFVIPQPLGKFDDVFMRWESITKIHVSVHPEEEDSDAIYSVSEGIDDTEQVGGSIETIFMLHEDPNKYLLGEAGGFRAQKQVSPEVYHCLHTWEQETPLPPDRRPDCTTCRRDLTAQSRAFCPKCNAITCALCAVPYFKFSKFVMQSRAPVQFSR